jgi:hypothetical protein
MLPKNYLDQDACWTGTDPDQDILEVRIRTKIVQIRNTGSNKYRLVKLTYLV